MKRAPRAFLLCGLVLAQVPFTGCSPTLDASELQQRCAEAQPAWDDYDEDLKAQIGATPVALWEGTPLQAWQTAAGVEVSFRLSGPWGEVAALLPVLLRTPEGEVYQSRPGASSGVDRVYFFSMQKSAEVMLPWVDLRFPREERRLYLRTPGKHPPSANG